MIGAAAPPTPASSGVLTDFRMRTVVRVVTRLLVIQYRPRPEGTLRENQPIMSGRNLRIACVCCCAGSSLFGVRIAVDTYCEMTSATGSTRYAAVSPQPSGGLKP